MSERTGIPLKHFRNGRTREANLRRAENAFEDGFRDGEDIPLGRPSNEDIVRKWQEEHPDGRRLITEKRALCYVQILEKS